MFADNLYKVSVAKAIQLGYEPVNDPQAWGGKCFQKKVGHKVVKWILFHPVLLLDKLKLHYEAELIKLGYCIEDFYNHHPDMVEMRNADNREARTRQDYEFEQQEHIAYIYAVGGIDPDEIDDDDQFEQIRQLGLAHLL